MELKFITREEWIEALESGKYKQCRGRLYDVATDSYCCIGVALKLAGVDFSKYTYKELEVSAFRSVLTEADADKLSASIGITLTNQYRTASLNDRDWSFHDIAEKLRKGIL